MKEALNPHTAPSTKGGRLINSRCLDTFSDQALVGCYVIRMNPGKLGLKKKIEQRHQFPFFKEKKVSTD